MQKNLSTYVCEINEFLKSIIDDSVITCDEIIHEMDTVSMNLNNIKATYKMDYYIQQNFLLVAVLLLITVTI